MTERLVRFLALFLLLGSLSPAVSHALDVKRHVAPSGLTIQQFERHNLPIVAVTLLIMASPWNEAPEKAGLANLTGAMLTEGTTSRTALDISSTIEYLGASLGVSTGRDFTTVSLSVLKKDVARGFDVFSDVLLRPSFPEDELKRKKELIKGGLRQREEDPSFVAEDRFIREVFGGEPYGRQVEGSIPSIDGLSRSDLVDFFGRYYKPEKSVLTVVGDLTPAELEDLLKTHLAPWVEPRTEQPASSVQAEQREAERAPESSAVTATAGPRRVIINRDITQANIVLGNRGLSRENPDYYAANIMNYILGGGGFASRLMRIVRDERGLAYSIYSFFSANKQPGQFSVEVQTKNESAPAVVGEILKQMRRIRQEAVSDQELEDAKAYLKGSFPRRLETTRKIADFLSALWFFNLGDDYVDKYPAYIDAVTKDDVRRVAEKYLQPENYRLVIVGSEKQMSLTDLEPSKNIR